MSTQQKKTRVLSTVGIGVRATPELRDQFVELIEIISADLGAKVSQSQVFEIMVREALEKRKRQG